MKQFRLTVKSDDTELVNAIMRSLRKDFELMDEPDECNRTLEDYLSDINRTVKDLSVLVVGNDFPSTVNALKGLKLVGEDKSDACPECGHPDYYYIGGMMLCSHCEYSEYADEPFIDSEL